MTPLYIVMFWSKTTQRWIAWNMQPVSLEQAEEMAAKRKLDVPGILRLAVIV